MERVESETLLSLSKLEEDETRNANIIGIKKKSGLKNILTVDDQ